MGNTYTQIHMQTIFAVQNRISLINPKWEKRLYEYMAGIIKSFDHKPLILNGMPDHIHILVSCKPSITLSNIVKEIKEHSSKYINEKGFIKGKFSWQEGFGAFSVSYRNIEQVVNYIKNQEEHHKIKSFKEEYLEFLNEQSIAFEEKYIFEEVK